MSDNIRLISNAFTNREVNKLPPACIAGPKLVSFPNSGYRGGSECEAEGFGDDLNQVVELFQFLVLNCFNLKVRWVGEVT